MPNEPARPDAENPFRAAFGAKARDPASVMDAMQQADQDRWELQAVGFEARNLDLFLVASPAMFLLGLWNNVDLSHIAYMYWAMTDLFWTPWLILRVDRLRPPGDTARATAFLGYAQLGWPLSVLAIELAPVKWEFVTAFPIVFLWSVAFAVLGVRGRAGKPIPTRGRTRMLAGGAAAYLVCAGLALAAAPWAWSHLKTLFLDLAPLVLGAILLGAFLVALPGLCLLPVARKTWLRATA